MKQSQKKKAMGKWKLLPLQLALLGVPLALCASAHAQTSAATDAATNTDATPVAAASKSTTAAPVSALPATDVVDSREPVTNDNTGIVAKRAVSGTKTDTPLVAVPQSVSVVTRDQMDAQGAATIDQALRYTAGVSSQDSTDFRFDQLRGRGFQYDEYLDGLILSPSAYYANPRIDPYFLESIEVLRGPASVLYGAGSPAGIVNMVSKMPTEDPVHELMLQIGNHDSYTLGFDMGGKVDDAGTVLYRVTGLARDANTQVNGIKNQRLSIAPSVTIRPTHDTSLTLFASYQRDPAGGLFDSLPQSGTATANANGYIPLSTYVGNPDKDYFQRTQYSFGYKFEQKLNDIFSFSSNFRYMHDDINYHQSYYGNWVSGSTSTVTMSAFLDREHLSQYALDNHVQAKFSTGPVEQTVLFGVDYQRLFSGVNSGSGSIGTLNLYDPDYSSLGSITTTTKRVDTSTDQLGVYLQDQIKYGHWNVTLGMRNDWAAMNVQSATATTGSVQYQQPHAFTWRGGVSYLFDSGIAPYFSYAKSFQLTAGADYSGKAFLPTTGKQYEVGVKYSPKSYNALYTFALYDLTQDNVTTTDPLHTGYSVQTGQIRSKGLEFEGHVELTRSLSMLGTFTYVNQVVTKTNTASALGKRPVMIPREMASLWFDYTLHGGVLNSLGFGAGARYIGASAGDAANSFNVSSATLFDASVHYDLGRHWKLGVNGSNLFNRRYAAYCSGGACYYGSGVEVLGMAKYQW